MLWTTLVKTVSYKIASHPRTSWATSSGLVPPQLMTWLRQWELLDFSWRLRKPGSMLNLLTQWGTLWKVFKNSKFLGTVALEVLEGLLLSSRSSQRSLEKSAWRECTVN